MVSKVLIIYHKVDLDGRGSAYLAQKGLMEKEDYSCLDIQFLGLNYNEFDLIRVCQHIALFQRVMIVDFSIDLIEKCDYSNTKITVIDHHQLSDELKDKYKRLNVELFWDDNLAAIELTYLYFWSDKQSGFVPRWVRLLGMYDSWRNEDKDLWNTKVLPFQMYMRSLNTDISKNLDTWKIIDNSRFEELQMFIQSGKLIMNYDKKQKENTIKNHGYECMFEGLRAIVCNTTIRSSQLFDSIWDEENYDIMIVYNFQWGFDKDKWAYSIYTTKTDKIDCSKIAKKYGGGGHKGAAGFHSDEKLV